MKIKRPGLLAATLIPIALHIILLLNPYQRESVGGALTVGSSFAFAYLLGYLLPPFAVSYTIWGICVLIKKAIQKSKSSESPAKPENHDSGKPILKTAVNPVSAGSSAPKMNEVYVKVATRADIPEGVKFDDQTGKKIVYIVEEKN